MKKLLVLLFLFISFITFSQELNVLEESNLRNRVLKYQESNNADQQVINFIIKKLASFSNINLYTYRINLSYEEKLRISKNRNLVKSLIIFRNFKFTKNIDYRRFDISDAIMPAELGFKGKLTGKENQTIAQYVVKSSKLNSLRNQFDFEYSDSTKFTNYKLILLSTDIIFNQSCKNRFLNRIKIIDDYYNVGHLISDASSDLRSINPNNIELIYEYNNIIEEVNKLIVDIENMNLESSLALGTNDPIFFKNRYRKLKTLAYNLDQEVSEVIANLYKIYYERGTEYLFHGNNIMARNMFMKSLHNNPEFAPSLFQLAGLDFMDNNLDGAANKLKELFISLRPDPGTRNQALNLCNSVFNSYLQFGNEALDSKLYGKALDIFENAESLCNSIYDFNCPHILITKISEAKTGIYNNYLSIADQYLQEGNLKNAEAEIYKAIDYQKLHYQDIPDANTAYALLNDVKYIEYNNFINEGKQLFSSKEFKIALNLFEKAKVLENNYSFHAAQELPDLLQNAARNLIILYIEKGKDYVKQNNIAKAKKIANKVFKLQNKYGLNEDNELNNLIAELKDKIFTQECINAQNKYKDHINDAYQFISKKDFLNTKKSYKSAIEVTEKFSECSIDISSAEYGLARYEPAITYQSYMLKSENFIKYGQYENAIQTYLEAGKHFEQSKVDEFGLTHIQFVEYASKSTLPFIAYCAAYSINKDEPDRALKLLAILAQRNYKKQKVKNEQKQLGIQFASRDYKKKLKQNPEVLILEYTKGNKWYKYLYKSYKKQWKKLNK